MYVHGMLFSIQMWPPNWQVASIVLLSVIIFNVGFLYLGLVSRDCPVYEAYQREKALEKCNFNKQEIKEFLNWTEKKRSIESLPVIYMITPTYSRWTQKADLTRLCNTLTHVPHLVWMVVEDSEGKTSLVTNLLRSCAVTSVHLNVRTEKNLQLGQQDPRWKKHRGVDQRNTAIKYLREHQYKNGVVYFGDDDNTYSIKLFEEMRGTKKVSVWPVGLSGELKFEGPVCEDGWVVGWHTSWEPSRPFPIDMAGFAVNSALLVNHSDVWIDPNVQRGYLESSLLSKLVSRNELEPKANMCMEVLVWHTRTEVPKMRQEAKLAQNGIPSNPEVEV